jgi:hypothetical protein
MDLVEGFLLLGGDLWEQLDKPMCLHIACQFSFVQRRGSHGGRRVFMTHKGMKIKFSFCRN